MVWFRFFILPTNKYRAKGLSFALCLQRKVESGIYSKNKNQAKKRRFMPRKTLDRRKECVRLYRQRQQKSPHGALVVGSFPPLQRTPQRLLSRVPWNK